MHALCTLPQPTPHEYMRLICRQHIILSLARGGLRDAQLFSLTAIHSFNPTPQASRCSGANPLSMPKPRRDPVVTPPRAAPVRGTVSGIGRTGDERPAPDRSHPPPRTVGVGRETRKEPRAHRGGGASKHADEVTACEGASPSTGRNVVCMERCNASAFDISLDQDSSIGSVIHQIDVIPDFASPVPTYNSSIQSEIFKMREH